MILPCSAECKEALALSQAQASNSRLSVHTAVSAAPVDLWSTAISGAGPTEEPQVCSSGRTPAEEERLPGAEPCGDSERLMAPTPPQKAQRRPRRSGSSGSPSEDNLSMTGLMNSGSEAASNRSSKARASTKSQGGNMCCLTDQLYVQFWTARDFVEVLHGQARVYNKLRHS